MKTLRVLALTILMAFLISLGTPWLALAPYHTQPPPPPPQPVVLTATLTASQEVPTPTAGTPATVIGGGVFLFDPGTGNLSFAVAYKGLSGPLTLAHFHSAAPGVAGGVVQTVCGAPGTPLIASCPTGNSGFLTGTWTVPAATVPTLLAGGLYFNIHTALNGTGEIRGQIVPR